MDVWFRDIRHSFCLLWPHKFMLRKYSDHWLNTYCYYGIYPENSPTNTCLDIERIYEDIEIQPVVENVLVNHYENDVECSQDTLLVNSPNMTVGKTPKITYHDMVKKLIELARTV